MKCSIILIICCTYICISCVNNKNIQQQQQTLHPNQTDLFANDKKDNLLIPINNNNQSSNLSLDSAFQKSSLVAICLPLAIDSFEQNNKTVFYLNTVKPLHILKGIHNNTSNISFITNTKPDFILHDSGWVIYVEPIQQKKLITQNYIQWQWLSNAPYHKTLF